MSAACRVQPARGGPRAMLCCAALHGEGSLQSTTPSASRRVCTYSHAHLHWVVGRHAVRTALCRHSESREASCGVPCRVPPGLPALLCRRRALGSRLLSGRLCHCCKQGRSSILCLLCRLCHLCRSRRHSRHLALAASRRQHALLLLGLCRRRRVGCHRLGALCRRCPCCGSSSILGCGCRPCRALGLHRRCPTLLGTALLGSVGSGGCHGCAVGSVPCPALLSIFLGGRPAVWMGWAVGRGGDGISERQEGAGWLC